LAERFDVSATLARVVFVTLSIFSAGFPGLLIYLVLWAVTPLDDVDDFDERN
jgi:phage shock protein C